MPTLDLTLQRRTDSGYPIIAALTRPGGFLPLRREGMLNLDIPALAELQYDQLAYGTALGQALFVDEIRDTFREGLAGGEPLRVLLSIEAPDLRALDWHRLAAPFDGRWRCLACQQNTPFSLSVPSPASAHFPALGRRDLRALLLVAGLELLSGDYKLAPFDVPATTASIQAALGDIPCDILTNPSLDTLCAALTATPYTFLHLVCHGAVNQSGETILFFPKDERRTPTPATDLLNRLGSLARLPHFAFIATCESALPQNGLGSLAGRLVRELGLPAVLAMTDRVSIATASAIAAPFYAHLYQHGQPDLALAQSLAGLQGAHDLTVPAIFSRLGDRPLFDDNSERALTNKELEFGLAKLAESLPERAPVMDSLRDTLTRRLRSTLGADSQSLSESSRTERKESLDQLNSLSLEALDLSFNALCLGQTPPAYDSRSPFRGLESFRPEDAAYFFGREALTRKLVQKLNEHNFLAVLGASGSGKSSLVMAGLIPALNVPYTIFRPGAEPLAELDKALQACPQLLVVDQFEELFTLSAREQRSDFISRLLEQSQRLRVVITLRADFLGEVAPFKSLKDEVQNHQEIIPPMDEAELRRAMEGQAGCAGLRFESDLSQQMLDDVSGEPGAMPLLQHALWTLWTRRHGRWLRAEEYRAFGGIQRAIATTADEYYDRLSADDRERMRNIFVRLTRLDESGQAARDTRRRAKLTDLVYKSDSVPQTADFVRKLADLRLVMTSGGTLEGQEIEVTHEALIRHWPKLRSWLDEDRLSLLVEEDIREAASVWDASDHDADTIEHRGGKLEDGLHLMRNPRTNLSATEKKYLEACKKKEWGILGRLQRMAGNWLGLIAILAASGFAGFLDANTGTLLYTSYLIAVVIPLLVVVIIYKLDNYNLVEISRMVFCLVGGVAGCILTGKINSTIYDAGLLDVATIIRYGSPVIQTALNGGILLGLLSRIKVARIIDGMIYGVTVGAGFAIVENFEYLLSTDTSSLTIAITRTLSVNLMHMASIGFSGFLFIAARYDRQKSIRLLKIVFGFTLPSMINSLFNIMVTTIQADLMYVAAPVFGLSAIGSLGAAIRYFVNQDQKWIDAFLQGSSSSLNNMQKITRAMRDLFGVVRASQLERYLALHARRSIIQKSLADLDDPKLKAPIEEQMMVVRKKIRGSRSVIGNYCWENAKFIIPEITKIAEEK